MTSPVDITLRVPPHSVEAEQSVLGGLLLDNAAFDRIAHLIGAGDFYRHDHRLIFGAIVAQVAACKPADVVTVFDALGGSSKAEDFGGLPYLNALAQSVPSAANIRRYAEIVRDRAGARTLIAAAGEALDAAWSDKPLQAKLDQIAGLLAPLHKARTTRQPIPMADLVRAALDRYTDFAEGAAIPAIPTGIGPLDGRLNGGLRPGKLYGLAARPSVGKSAAARAIALHAAGLGHVTLVLSMEMPGDEITDAVLGALGRVDSQRLQTGRLTDDDWGRLAEAADKARSLPLYVDDQGGLTLADIRNKARQVEGLELLVIDYLQLSRSTLKNATTNDQIAELSKGLKALAMELGIPVLLLSQLNREVERRADKEPQLSDLRDSGAIEQDLDVAILLWTTREYDDGARRIVGWKVAKHRGGPKGRFGMEFDAPIYRWAPTTESIDPPERAHGGSNL